MAKHHPISSVRLSLDITEMLPIVHNISFVRSAFLSSKNANRDFIFMNDFKLVIGQRMFRAKKVSELYFSLSLSLSLSHFLSTLSVIVTKASSQRNTRKKRLYPKISSRNITKSFSKYNFSLFSPGEESRKRKSFSFFSFFFVPFSFFLTFHMICLR